MVTEVEPDPLMVEALGRCTTARLNTLTELDLMLMDSTDRDNYGVTEVRNLLLDLRNILRVAPR